MIAVFDDVGIAQLSCQGLGVGAGDEDAGEMPRPEPYDAPALLERVSLNGHVAVLRKLPVRRQHCTRKRNKKTMPSALCYTASLSKKKHAFGRLTRHEPVWRLTLRSIFQLALRHGIWRVTLDGAFFGDYRAKAHALDGLSDARRELTAAGRSIDVLMPAEAD